MWRSLHTRAAWMALGAIATLLAACSPAEGARAHLIRIDAVEQRWDQTQQLFARGAGMPRGMRGEARLSGLVFLPGQSATAIDARVPCRALDESLVAIEVEDALREVEGDGTFEGRLELQFGAQASGRVVGRLEQVRARLGRRPTLEQEFRARQHAQSFQRALGLHELLLGDDGVSVAELDADGPAARAGLARQDVVTRIAGRPVQLPRDLIAPPETFAFDIELQRGPLHTRHVVHVALPPDQLPQRAALYGLGFALGASLSVLGCGTLPRSRLWAPRRREYWLTLCSLVCVWLIGLLLCDMLAPALAVLSRASLLGLLAGGTLVCCYRLLVPTSRTTRDADLAPLV
jgi:hypothetical protein